MSLRLADIRPIENVTFLDDPHETVIATVSVPRGFAELEEAEAEAAAEAEAEAAGGRRGGEGEGAPTAEVEDSGESSEPEE